MKKDLLISTSFSLKWNDLKPWIRSINNTDFSGDKILIVYNMDKETIEKISNEGFLIVATSNPQKDGSYKYEFDTTNKNLAIEKFGHLWIFLKDKIDLYENVLMTGCRDVIFQSNPFNYIKNIFEENKNKKIILSPEPTLFKNETWFNGPNALATLGQAAYLNIENSPIFSSDVIAGKTREVADFFALIHQIIKYNPVFYSDQAVLNFVASLEPLKSSIYYSYGIEGWAAQVGLYFFENFKLPLVPIEPSPIWKNNKVLTYNQLKEFDLVHQYDRSSHILKYINDLYE